MTFDVEDPDTWQWLVELVAGRPCPHACVCGDCGEVWPDGAHLTELLAHDCPVEAAREGACALT